MSPRVALVYDAIHAEDSRAAWHAADVFNSLSDNIQESLGLTLLEAQAAGLPAVTSDWDGCRETIEPGRTGFLVATRGGAGATADDSSRLLIGEISQAEFLGRTNQTIAVDCLDATSAFYLPRARATEPTALARLIELAQQPCLLAFLEAIPELASIPRQERRATLAWLLKYDLLRVVSE